MIGSLFTSIVSRVAKDAGKSGIERLFTRTEVQRAIERTATEFDDSLSVEPSLTKWSDSDEFATLLTDVVQGRTVLRDDTLVNSFINVSDFFDRDTTLQSAHAVLAAFGRNLYDELYSGKRGLSTLAARGETLHVETREQVREDLMQCTDRVMSEITTLADVVKEAVQPIRAEASPSVEEQIFFSRIDEAMKLLRKGRAEVARSMLLELRQEEATRQASANVHFRIAANLASCSLQLDDPETARAELRTALSLNPTHRQAISYASLAAMALGEREEAVDYSARSCPPEEHTPELIANRIRVLHFAGRVEEIKLLIAEKPWIVEDPACSFVLGLIRLNEGEYSEAESYFRTSLRGDQENPHTHRLLAEAIIIPLDQKILSDPPLPWRVHTDVQLRVKEVERELTTSVELFEKYDNRSRVHEALIQRAYVRGLLGEIAQGVADCDRVLGDKNNHGEALRHKGQLLLLDGEIDQAIRAFSRIDDESEKELAAPAMAHALIKLGKDQEVIDLLSKSWRSSERQRMQLVISDLLIHAHHRKGHAEMVETMIRAIEETWNEEPEVLVVVARQRVREGRIKEAIELLQRGLEHAADSRRDQISLELADLYCDSERWLEAAELYEGIVEQSDDNPILRKYVVALFNSGSYRKALTLAEKVRAASGAIPIISEIEARLLDYAGDLDAARELYAQLSRIEPAKIKHRLAVATLYLRAGQNEEAKTVVEGISFDQLRDDAHALLRVAVLRQFLGLGGFLQMAYRARRIDSANPKTQLGYVQIFLSRGSDGEAELSPEVVGLDCTVHLQSEKESKTFTILDDDDIDPVRGEIAEGDPRTRKLLGLKTGEQVIFKEGQPDERVYTIAEVKNKYVHAFQETLSKFPDWFYGNPGLMAVDVSGNDFSQLFSLLERRAEFGREVMGLYAQRLLSIGAISTLSGKSLFEVWVGLTGTFHGVRVFTSVGSGEEASAENKLVANDSIVVELTALFTLCRLGRLDLLARLFSRIVIAQASLDELNELIIEHERSGKPTKVVWKEGDHFAYEEMTEEIYSRRLDFLKSIRQFIQDSAEVAPATAVLDISTEQFERLQEVLGKGAIASILVAKEKEIPLYVDDLGLRQIAAGDWEVPGFWTQTVLQRMRQRGLISAAEYYEALRVLILSNYFFLSVDFRALWWMLRYYGVKSAPEVDRILGVLTGPDCDEESAIMVGAELVYRVWLEGREEAERLKLIDDIVRVIIRGRDKERVKAIFAATVHARFSHYRKPLGRILPRIEAFEPDETSMDDRQSESEEVRAIAGAE